MIAPHGGTLINRTIDPRRRRPNCARRARACAASPSPVASSTIWRSIANGAFSPLTGFMNRKDYESVVATMRLAGGLPWSIPVVLAVDRDEAPTVGSRAALHDGEGVCAASSRWKTSSSTINSTKRRTSIVPKTKSIPASRRSTSARKLLVGGPVWDPSDAARSA